MLTDEEIFDLVRGPLMPDGTYHPVDRPMLVAEMMERGMQSAPAYRRVARLIRRGALSMSENPPHPMRGGKVRRKAAWIWVPDAAAPRPAVGARGRPREYAAGDLLMLMKIDTNTPDTAKGYGDLYRLAQMTSNMSRWTVKKLVRELVSQGHVAEAGGRYYVTAEGMDVEILQDARVPDQEELV